MLYLSTYAGRNPLARNAFTLIELMVTVVIIAILATIAIPQYMLSQTKAKVSRARADLQTLATAIESYSIDNNAVPYDGKPLVDDVGWVESLVLLTTPVGYLSQIPSDQFQDPSVVSWDGVINHLDYPEQNVHPYRYGTRYYWTSHPKATDTIRKNIERAWITSYGYSSWVLTSAGPYRKFWDINFGGKGNRYDSTNGVISVGGLYRSQALAE